jgi:hypothetical protein
LDSEGKRLREEGRGEREAALMAGNARSADEREAALMAGNARSADETRGSVTRDGTGRLTTLAHLLVLG